MCFQVAMLNSDWLLEGFGSGCGGLGMCTHSQHTVDNGGIDGHGKTLAWIGNKKESSFWVLTKHVESASAQNNANS